MNESRDRDETSASSSFELRTPRITLENDVVLAPQTRRMFDEAIGAMRHHKTIYTDWGFGAVDPTGRNMVVNFYGPPGTGKTLAAEALAGTLKRPFLHIGISELESKYVGETAKNITNAFREADAEGALLFFDEADTLLGARLSSVTQGIDNEINAMRSTLLIELERCEGVVVFATNFAKNYDNAFVSRIRYHIEFALPDFDGRKRLWQRMLVSGVPLGEPRADLIERCAAASDGLSGREIRTVLRTAFPRAILSAPAAPIVYWSHIETAIDDVRAAHRNVGKHRPPPSFSQASADAGRQLLGLAD
ncbi:AAA family ATPase [Paraburkholderia sp. JPY303]|uniref:ATP-binding protein n=1 Tax=Paraburkholderia atlantica TaxID=2654982 RepID=UPI0015915E38|nr:ATP-binding protein [Paraburkholderia atlantica]MBB5414799.1 AAA+ superfamily predicted ATPase [Paraburkholderia atlantica]NUY29302.1 AAA family ATPase [Paraburkholderia atlantica]